MAATRYVPKLASPIIVRRRARVARRDLPTPHGILRRMRSALAAAVDAAQLGPSAEVVVGRHTGARI